MRGTNCAEIETFATVATLPDAALALLDQAAGIFASRTWWDVAASHAMQAGASALFVTVRMKGEVVALLPMLQVGGCLTGWTTPYTCQYALLFAHRLDRPGRVAAMAAFARFCRPFGVVRLDALPAEWDGLGDLLKGARRARSRLLRFDHFGNWHEDVVGLDWASYLLRRPGALRETIRRRLRRAEKLPGARFVLLSQPGEMDHAAAAFESVYNRSWKDPEPFPAFNVALMRAMAEIGLLRFGVWSIGAEPVAVQFWVVREGCATVLKLAHDEAHKAYSPGTVLTALMLRHFLDHEHVGRIDFGRGDDGYKQGWAAQRRQRIGVLLVNPWRWSGMLALLRHVLGRVRARASVPPHWFVAACGKPVRSAGH